MSETSSSSEWRGSAEYHEYMQDMLLLFINRTAVDDPVFLPVRNEES